MEFDYDKEIRMASFDVEISVETSDKLKKEAAYALHICEIIRCNMYRWHCVYEPENRDLAAAILTAGIISRTRAF